MVQKQGPNLHKSQKQRSRFDYKKRDMQPKVLETLMEELADGMTLAQLQSKYPQHAALLFEIKAA